MTKNVIEISKDTAIAMLIALVILAGVVFYFVMKEKAKPKIIMVDDEVIDRLKQVQKDSSINADVQKELAEIERLLNTKSDLKAISSVAKVIENLLKRLYKSDQEFKEAFKKLNPNKKRPDFADYLKYASDHKVITQEQFLHISAIKEVRNEEAHELGVMKEKLLLVSYFLLGFNVITSLSNLLYMRRNDDNLSLC